MYYLFISKTRNIYVTKYIFEKSKRVFLPLDGAFDYSLNDSLNSRWDFFKDMNVLANCLVLKLYLLLVF